MKQSTPDLDLSRFRGLFLEEASDLIQELETGFLELDQPQVTTERLHSIFRAAHSIKGNAGMTGYEAVTEFTHVIESTLDELRSGLRKREPSLTRTLLQALDCLKQMLAAPPEAPEPGYALAIRELLQPSHPPAPTTTESATPTITADHYRIAWTPPTDCMARGVDPLRILETLASLGELSEIDCNLTALPRLAELSPELSYLSWTFRLATNSPIDDIRDIFTFQDLDAHLEIDPLPIPAETEPPPPPAGAAPSTSAPAPSGETIRVTSSKIDVLFDLVSEMVIAQSMAMQTIHSAQAATSDRAALASGPLAPSVSSNREQNLQLQQLTRILGELDRQTRELQQHLMGLRLVPVDQVFRRLPRLVHDLSSQLEKKIELEILGADTEIDRALVEQLNDPLVHLLRNCADHGIEPPSERIRRGKPETGKIRITARCQGGSTIVDIEDDGRGIDTEKIRNKALRLGLIKSHPEPTEKQLLDLIFHPGFSTAEQITSISGRGVGMDAVRRNIESISGSVSVSSIQGQGSRFHFHLPLTMAILDGLLVSVAGQVLVIPLLAVVECLRPLASQIRRIPQPSGDFHEVLLSRNRVLPLLRLTSVFPPSDKAKATAKASQRQQQPTADGAWRHMAILIEHNNQQTALVADEILGQQQIVIKSLDTNYQRIDGCQGATILGDGRVALVVDLGGLMRIDASRAAARDAAAREKVER